MRMYLFISLLVLPFHVHAFSDVPSENMYFDAIAYVQEHGIVEGYQDGTFQSDASINRAEFTKIIVETLFEETVIEECDTDTTFSDVPTDRWFSPYVCVAKKQGLIDGYDDPSDPSGQVRTFRPADTINFAESAKILAEAFDLEDQVHDRVWYKLYVDALSDARAIPVSIFDFDIPITRGEMASMIYRLHTEKTDALSLNYAVLNKNRRRQQSAERMKYEVLAAYISDTMLSQFSSDMYMEEDAAFHLYSQLPERYQQQAELPHEKIDSQYFQGKETYNTMQEVKRRIDSSYTHGLVGDAIDSKSILIAWTKLCLAESLLHTNGIDAIELCRRNRLPKDMYPHDVEWKYVYDLEAADFVLPFFVVGTTYISQGDRERGAYYLMQILGFNEQLHASEYTPSTTDTYKLILESIGSLLPHTVMAWDQKDVEHMDNVFNLDFLRIGDRVGHFVYIGKPDFHTSHIFEGSIILEGQYKWVEPGYNPLWSLHVVVDDPDMLQMIPVFNQNLAYRNEKKEFRFVLTPSDELKDDIPQGTTGRVRFSTDRIRYLTLDIGASHSIGPAEILEVEIDE